MGLDAVRELTRATIRRIIARRPYVSMEDFLIRAQPLHSEAVNLVKAGALEGLGRTADMVDSVQTEPWHGRHAAQLRLPFDGLPPNTPEPSSAQRAAWENEILGNLISVHRLELVADELARTPCIQSAELARHMGETVTLAGARIAAHDVPYARQQSLWLDLEDEAGAFQVVLEGGAYRRFKALARSREPLLVRGRVAPDPWGRGTVVVAETIQRIAPKIP